MGVVKIGILMRIFMQISIQTQIVNLQPNFISGFQMERRLEWKRLKPVNSDVTFGMPSTDRLPIQFQNNADETRGIIKSCNCREGKKVSPGSWGREDSRWRMHRSTFIESFQFEWNWRFLLTGRLLLLDVKISWHRLDVTVSNSPLETWWQIISKETKAKRGLV